MDRSQFWRMVGTMVVIAAVTGGTAYGLSGASWSDPSKPVIMFVLTVIAVSTAAAAILSLIYGRRIFTNKE
jgi:hypothetical protein